MKNLNYLSKKTHRVFTNYETAYKDAVSHRIAILDQDENVAKIRAANDIQIVFVYINE